MNIDDAVLNKVVIDIVRNPARTHSTVSVSVDIGDVAIYAAQETECEIIAEQGTASDILKTLGFSDKQIEGIQG